MDTYAVKTVNHSVVKAYQEAMSFGFTGKHFKVALAYIKAFQKNIINSSQLSQAFDAINEHQNVIAVEYPEYSSIDDIIAFVESRLDDYDKDEADAAEAVNA